MSRSLLQRCSAVGELSLGKLWFRSCLAVPVSAVNAAKKRYPAVMVGAESKLPKHFQDMYHSFGQSTGEDLTQLGQAKLAADLHAAVTACIQQQYSAALVRFQIDLTKKTFCILVYWLARTTCEPLFSQSRTAGPCPQCGASCMGGIEADRLGSSCLEGSILPCAVVPGSFLHVPRANQNSPCSASQQ